MHVLENNKKPATHFIEVFNNCTFSRLFPIFELETNLYITSKLRTLRTIAIFKIRMK